MNLKNIRLCQFQITFILSIIKYGRSVQIPVLSSIKGGRFHEVAMLKYNGHSQFYKITKRKKLFGTVSDYYLASECDNAVDLKFCGIDKNMTTSYTYKYKSGFELDNKVFDVKTKFEFHDENGYVEPENVHCCKTENSVLGYNLNFECKEGHRSIFIDRFDYLSQKQRIILSKPRELDNIEAGFIINYLLINHTYYF